jgi:sec-independent protein translocase protein TatA
MGIGFRELLVILVVVLLVFGTKKLKTIGSDLGAAVRGFKKSMNEGEDEESGKKLAREERPDADFSSSKGERDSADSSKNA